MSGAAIITVPPMAFLLRIITRLFWIGLALLAVGLACGTISGLFAHRYFLCELATHFQLHYVLLLAIVAAIFALDGRFRWATFALVVGASAFCYHLLPLYTGGQPKSAQPRTLRLVSANIAYFNETPEQVLEFLSQEKPDVILLFEFTPEWQEKLKSLSERFPYSETRPAAQHSGIALYSRVPLEDARIETIGLDPSPIVVATAAFDNRKLTIVGAHPAPPIVARAVPIRNDQLKSLSALVNLLPTPLVLAGDLNTSGWNPVFKDLVYSTGLQDSRLGYGVQPTWTVQVPLVRTPIDHCLVSRGVEVLDRRVGPDVGSDHYPIIVDLLVK